jgi:hypothetical protein
MDDAEDDGHWLWRTLNEIYRSMTCEKFRQSMMEIKARHSIMAMKWKSKHLGHMLQASTLREKHPNKWDDLNDVADVDRLIDLETWVYCNKNRRELIDTQAYIKHKRLIFTYSDSHKNYN